MTGSCRSSPGAGFSPFCWIASDSWGHKLKCGTRSDCRSAALSWGNCVFLSCAFDRGSAMAPAQFKVWIGDWIWSWTSNHPTQRCKFFIFSFLSVA